ncbi:MAG: hypothetical protein K2K95_01295 [Muribaculaceae bacterium]|nr:hypothetical protein [Muribaculaceae bacterium]
MRLQRICDTTYDAERYPDLKWEDVTALFDAMSGYYWTTSSEKREDWFEKLGLPRRCRSGFR